MPANSLLYSAIAAAVTSFCASVATAGVVESTFDTDAEGWGFLNDARDFSWTDAQGNPEGSITARDRGTGAIWYYAASDAYLGDQSSVYGGVLSWEILGITGNQTSITGRADVMLVGAGLAIGFNTGVQPVNGAWVASSAILSDAGDWQTVTQSNGVLSGNTASRADIEAVLADLTGLFIRGEYTNGSDATALDNVALVPAPGAVFLLTSAGLLGIRRRR